MPRGPTSRALRACERCRKRKIRCVKGRYSNCCLNCRKEPTRCSFVEDTLGYHGQEFWQKPNKDDTVYTDISDLLISKESHDSPEFPEMFRSDYSGMSTTPGVLYTQPLDHYVSIVHELLGPDEVYKHEQSATFPLEENVNISPQDSKLDLIFNVDYLHDEQLTNRNNHF